MLPFNDFVLASKWSALRRLCDLQEFDDRSLLPTRNRVITVDDHQQHKISSLVQVLQRASNTPFYVWLTLSMLSCQQQRALCLYDPNVGLLRHILMCYGLALCQFRIRELLGSVLSPCNSCNLRAISHILRSFLLLLSPYRCQSDRLRIPFRITFHNNVSIRCFAFIQHFLERCGQVATCSFIYRSFRRCGSFPSSPAAS